MVRSINASMSRSTYMLMALAPPADRVPPMTVAIMSHSDGNAPALDWEPSATTIVGTVLTSSNSMMRGFVSAMYAPTFEPLPARAVEDDAGTGDATVDDTEVRLCLNHHKRPIHAVKVASLLASRRASRLR